MWIRKRTRTKTKKKTCLAVCEQDGACPPGHAVTSQVFPKPSRRGAGLLSLSPGSGSGAPPCRSGCTLPRTKGSDLRPRVSRRRGGGKLPQTGGKPAVTSGQKAHDPWLLSVDGSPHGAWNQRTGTPPGSHCACLEGHEPLLPAHTGDPSGPALDRRSTEPRPRHHARVRPLPAVHGLCTPTQSPCETCRVPTP